MKYSELKKMIKAEAKLMHSEEYKEAECISYITYDTDYRDNITETLSSNFIEDCSTITDDQLFKAESEGLIKKDYDTYLVLLA